MMDTPILNIIDLYIVHYCATCGWNSDSERYVDLAALISWTKEYQAVHSEICTGTISTRCTRWE